MLSVAKSEHLDRFVATALFTPAVEMLRSTQHDGSLYRDTYGLDPAAARCWVARAGSSLVGGSITGSGAAQPDTVA